MASTNYMSIKKSYRQTQTTPKKIYIRWSNRHTVSWVQFFTKSINRFFSKLSLQKGRFLIYDESYMTTSCLACRKVAFEWVEDLSALENGTIWPDGVRERAIEWLPRISSKWIFSESIISLGLKFGLKVGRMCQSPFLFWVSNRTKKRLVLVKYFVYFGPFWRLVNDLHF